MPAEAARLKRQVGRRDRRFFAALACAAVVATPAIIFAGRHETTPSSREGAACVDVAHAGVLGGGRYHYCGADAVEFCRRFAGDSGVTAQCEAFGRASGVATASLRRSVVDRSK
jgi:hypothetical protein